MDYNNFYLRVLFSFFIISTYFLFTFFNFNYIFYLILLLYIFIFIEVYFTFKNYKYVPIFYIFISLIFFLLIDFSDIILKKFNLYISIVIIFDIFSYLIGKTLGKNQLIKISPNKTYEGFIGGILCSFILSLLLAYYFNFNINLKLFFFITLIILSSFVGDLIESFFKRKNNIKNSSEIIPGHGGIFDRFDSFLFSIIFYSIFSNLLL